MTNVVRAVVPIGAFSIHDDFVLCFSLELPIQFLCFVRVKKNTKVTVFEDETAL